MKKDKILYISHFCNYTLEWYVDSVLESDLIALTDVDEYGFQIFIVKGTNEIIMNTFIFDNEKSARDFPHVEPTTLSNHMYRRTM